MENHKHVLIIINEFKEPQVKGVKGILDTFREQGAQLSLMFAIPQIPAYYYQIPSMELMRAYLVQDAEKCLQKAGQILGIPTEHQWVEMGSFKTLITQAAHRVGADFTLIVGDGNRKATHPIPEKSFFLSASEAA